VSTLLADFRFAVRLLWRAPVFSLVAIFTLALGIGANTAIFSAVYDAILLPLPYQDPERVMMVWEDASFVSFPRNTPAPANYFDWKRLNHSFVDMAATRGQSANLTTDGPPEQVLGRAVTANFFSVLGVTPMLGRSFTEDEDRTGAPLVVISYRLWQRRYGGDSGVVGKAIPMSGTIRTIIGVMPRRFAFRNRDLDFWTPVHFTPEDVAQRNSHFLSVVARLAPGVTVAAARADMNTVARQLGKDYPQSNGRLGAVVVPIREDLLGDVHMELLVLMAAAGCVLLIACANLASLLLARATNRRGELAVRASLGATVGQLARQLTIEGVVLAVVGGSVGLALAPVSLGLIGRLIPTSMPPIDRASVSGPVLLFTLGLSLLTGVLFSLMPAFEAARASLVAGLHHAGRLALGRHRFGSAMVVVQVAVAMALLVSTALLLRTLSNLRGVDLGFRADHVLTVRTTLPIEKYGDKARRLAFYDRVLEQVRGLANVENAGYVSTMPFESIGNTRSYRYDAGLGEGEPTDALFRVGTNSYLQTLGVQIVAGRLIDDRDGVDAPRAIVVNETLARRHWPQESALGHRLSFSRPGTDAPWFTIVGVVKNVRERGYEREMKPGVYIAFAQTDGGTPENLVVRAKGNPLDLAAPIRRIVTAADPEQPVAAVRTLDEIVDLDVADRQQQLMLLGAFAGLALVLSAIGLYGLLGYNVSERRREIGVRMALGARARTVVGSIVGRGLLLTLVGVALGAVIAGLAGRTMRSLLYGVGVADPMAFGVSAAAFAAVALLASSLPALRAARVDPMTALREE
jgi:putative ABC transport system permease protein